MTGRKPTVELADFQRIEVRAGRVKRAEAFPEARKPAIKLWIDFGDPVGVLQSSAQLTRHYDPSTLVETDVIAVVNFPPLRIAGFKSECLVLGVIDPDDPGGIVLVRPDRPDTRSWELG